MYGEQNQSFTHPIQLYKSFPYRFGHKFVPLNSWRVLPGELYNHENLIAFVFDSFGVGEYRVATMGQHRIVTVLRFSCEPKQFVIRENQWSKIFVG